MNRLSYSSRCALIVNLVNELHFHGSWCGETHIQKAMYISQDLAKTNFGYKFVMYKHGPFSFDLKDELAAMRANGIIEFAFPQRGYGPSIHVTPFGERVYDTNQENIENYCVVNNFVAKWLATSDVRELERLATAYYVTKKNPRDSIVERAKKINSIKPHIDIAAAEEAIKIVENEREHAKRGISSVR